ncbi:hypothetical protein D7V86_06770 [bacterium D16-51]|nr:hypothetical protein D7V96_07200 [bacterium D16-59]RKI61015.1 hypothetical protein D7V86_06770 [bacterium D16-51]
MRRRWKLIILAVCLIAACAGIFIWQKSGEKGVQGQLGQFRKERKESDGTKSRKIEDRRESRNTVPLEKEEEAEEESGSLDEVTGIKESLLQTDGKTLQSRILAPEGYQRTACKKGSFAEFLRNYPLKKHGSPVLLYSGEEKGNQEAHAAVFKLPIEKEDLQQCADSVMRMYAEYFWKTGQKERIRFHFVDGFLAEYTKWRDGYRIQTGDFSSWVKSADYNDSYSNFKKFMRIVFAYAGTLSMEEEAKKIPLKKLQAGDIFIKGASPGHVVMVVDVCKDKDGKKAFLLAQGYMPAQEFQLLKNPLHQEDLWYYQEEIGDTFQTPEYSFTKDSFRRPSY